MLQDWVVFTWGMWSDNVSVYQPDTQPANVPVSHTVRLCSFWAHKYLTEEVIELSFLNSFNLVLLVLFHKVAVQLVFVQITEM